MSSDSPLSVLVFAASLRKESFNRRLAAIAERVLRGHGAKTKLSLFDEFTVPAYNADVEDSDGMPPGAQEFKQQLENSDAFVIVSPEYNGSMPGTIKNLIDWTSRFSQQPFDRRHALLMSASPSMTGGNRGLWALRIPLEVLGTRVFPSMFSLAVAHKAFDGDELADEALAERLDKTVSAFLELAEAAKRHIEE